MSETDGAFLAGAGVASLVALAVHSGNTEHHQQEVQQAYSEGYWKGRDEIEPLLAAKDSEIARLTVFLRQKDVEIGKKDSQIALLTATNESLAATVKAQQLQATAKIFPRDGEDNNLN